MEFTFLETFIKSDIFTPDLISKQMAAKLKPFGSVLEPSVGSGNLLKFIDKDQYDKIDVFDIKQQYLNEIPYHPKIKKHLCDFLKFETNEKYTNIILNPPYIKIQDLPYDYVSFIKSKWPILNNGNIDIYYAFLLKCLELLDDEGVMVSITPNTYLHNKSSLSFRKYLLENKIIDEIIDFKDEKVFEGASVYCCITVFRHKKKECIIYNNTPIYYNEINTTENKLKLIHLNNNGTSNSKTLKNIARIYNGIATLRDSIYIHNEKLFDEPCWRPITTSKQKKFCIYPYTDDGTILDEEIFKTNNKKTYNYLLEHKDVLAERDNGNKTYVKWYAYGRTQSLIVSKKEKVIYIPTLINPKSLSFTLDAPTLHIGCLCIEPQNVEDIDFIMETIKKNMEYIVNNSSKKNNGWINLSTTILYNLPIN
jgi:hypothetical protein